MVEKYRIEQLSYSLVDEEKNKYFLSLNGRRYYVGKLVVEILELLNKEKSYYEIASELNRNHDTDFFDELSIQKTIEVDFVQQGMLGCESENSSAQNSHQQYIYCRFNFLKPTNFPRILRILGKLFTPLIFNVISFLSIVLTTFFLIKKYDTLMYDGMYSLQMFLFFFLFSTVNTFWHEMGHATAAYRFGIDPKDIGFGFYIVYPIFFTDVSDIWQLNKNQRNIVNLGGIYFQLIANLILIGLYYLSPLFWITPFLIVINTGVALISLNPFFRYDGYWVYSDSFNLTNLRSQSNLCAKSFFQKIIGKENRSWSELFSIPKSLIFYSLTSTLFFVVIFSLLMFNFVNQISDIGDIIKNVDVTGWTKEILWSVLSKAFAVVMLPIFIVWFITKRKSKK